MIVDFQPQRPTQGAIDLVIAANAQLIQQEFVHQHGLAAVGGRYLAPYQLLAQAFLPDGPRSNASLNAATVDGEAAVLEKAGLNHVDMRFLLQAFNQLTIERNR